jgi:hypothetical protein
MRGVIGAVENASYHPGQGDMAMHPYRAHLVADGKVPGSAEVIDCCDDDEAASFGSWIAVFEAREVEVWDGDRLVARFTREDREVGFLFAD